nr:hypothetical protein CFP56_52244 [Quercus suber]
MDRMTGRARLQKHDHESRKQCEALGETLWPRHGREHVEQSCRRCISTTTLKLDSCSLPEFLPTLAYNSVVVVAPVETDSAPS